MNQMVLDGLATVIAVFLAFQLRFDGDLPAIYQPVMWAWVLLLPALRLALIYALGGYNAIWRYFSLHDAAVLVATVVPSSLCLLVLRFGLRKLTWLANVPVGVVVLEAMLFMGLAIGLRALRRITFEASRGYGPRRRAVLVGTDDTLAAALRHVVGYTDIECVGLLAPEARLRGLRIGGFSVIDEPEALARLLASHAVDLVLLSDASLDCISATVATATEFGVDVRLLPSATNVIHGQVRVAAQPKPELAVMDRAAAVVSPHPAVLEAFRDRVVLVTGAGGSIGSELSRQVSHLPTREVLLLDQDENSIFDIYHELLAARPEARLVPLVGSVRNQGRLLSILQRHRPHIVLHAAAYKHVPVMESNCCEAVLNNVFGTRELALLAAAHGVESFLMISTDKSVRPVSVMGASKRLAELVVQSLAHAAHNGATGARFACVRFGNVVGSRGSVVPIFLRQIAAGGPITITDEHMTRYFMTIPEAVQLVLQASTLTSDSLVYMLDMGDPVKITRLAQKLIEMSGLRPGIDIQIQFIGVRPGEKLEEQLWTEGATVTPTGFPRVLAVQTGPVPPEFGEALRQLEEAALAGQDELVVERLQRFSIGFTPQRSKSPAA
ncbi:MAG: polysaccharide biosynthesis protein, partial [Terriglobales bacterium]